jgi:hypothetical protein
LQQKFGANAQFWHTSAGHDAILTARKQFADVYFSAKAALVSSRLLFGKTGEIHFKGELMDNFDFDEWVVLAKSAPDEFEQWRCDVIEKLISNSNGNIRCLRGL